MLSSSNSWRARSGRIGQWRNPVRRCTSATLLPGSVNFRMRWSPPASKFAARSSGQRIRLPGDSVGTSSSTNRFSTPTSPKQKDPWYGDKSQSTLWEEKKPAANRIHPTAKPVELVERALLNSSKAGDIVADLFGGSGSTLIGCERRGRKARLMEIDPKYADCIVRRYQEYTGKKAVLDGDGRTFEEVAAERPKDSA